MSGPNLRRADRAMTSEQAMRSLERGYAGRLATVSEDGYPYCVPLLYIWADNQVFLHGTSARGHLRTNIEREPRACFEIDEPDDVITRIAVRNKPRARQVSFVTECERCAGTLPIQHLLDHSTIFRRRPPRSTHSSSRCEPSSW